MLSFQPIGTIPVSKAKQGNAVLKTEIMRIKQKTFVLLLIRRRYLFLGHPAQTDSFSTFSMGRSYDNYDDSLLLPGLKYCAIIILVIHVIYEARVPVRNRLDMNTG